MLVAIQIPKKKDIAAHFKMKPQTLSDLIKNKEAILAKEGSSKFILSQTRDRNIKYSTVDEALLLWFREKIQVPDVTN